MLRLDGVSSITSFILLVFINTRKMHEKKAFEMEWILSCMVTDVTLPLHVLANNKHIIKLIISLLTSRQALLYSNV